MRLVTTLTLKMEMDAPQLALFKLPIFAQDLQVSATLVSNTVLIVLTTHLAQLVIRFLPGTQLL